VRSLLACVALLSLGCANLSVEPVEGGGHTYAINVKGDTSAMMGGESCITDRSTVEVAIGSDGSGDASLTHTLDADGNVTSRTWKVIGSDARITERRNWTEAEANCAFVSGGGMSESVGAASRSWLQRAADVLIGVFGGAILL
jgi:hypothetical protein